MIFGTGCYPEPQITKHYLVDHIALASWKPFDWVRGYDVEEELGFLLPVKDQGSSKSCVGQAAATLAYVHNAFELKPVYEHITHSALTELSAKSVYSQIALSTGGAFAGDALKLISKFGINKESDVPSYDNGQPLYEDQMIEDTWRNDYLYARAKNYKSKEYRFVYERESIDLIAQTIAECGGLLLGIFIDDFDSWVTPFPKTALRRMYSHLVYAGKAKIINGKRYIGILNSWGVGVGTVGWQWLPAEYFQSGMVHTAGVMTDEVNSTWIKFFDNKGKPRSFPTYMAKSIKYMIGRGSTLAKTYDE